MKKLVNTIVKIRNYISNESPVIVRMLIVSSWIIAIIAWQVAYNISITKF